MSVAAERIQVMVAGARARAEGLGAFLAGKGLTVADCAEASGLAAQVAEALPQVVIVDLDADPAGPAALCGKLRAAGAGAIILIGAASRTAERVAALESGADSVVEPPVSQRELLARVRSLLRRPPAGAAVAKTALTAAAGRGAPARRPVPPKLVPIGSLTFEPEALRLVTAAGEDLKLSAQEAQLLAALVERPNRILTRAQIADLIDKDELAGDSRAIDAAVTRLRRKLEADAEAAAAITTVKGEGYSFRPGGSPG